MAQSEYDKGYADGQRNTAREMSKAAYKVEKELRDQIGRLQNTIDYLKGCVSCADFNCNKRSCNLPNGSCINFNKWRMPE